MKNVNVARYAIVLIGIGMMMGLVVFLIKQMLSIYSIGISPDFVGGGIFGAGFAVTIISINRMIKNGRCKWLEKE